MLPKLLKNNYCLLKTISPFKQLNNVKLFGITSFKNQNISKISNELNEKLQIKNSVHLLDSNDPEVFKTMEQFMIIKEDFINENEEKSLLDEIDPYMKRLRYEFDHWDDAIHGYRETERLNWNEQNSKILERVKKFAFESFAGTEKTNLLNHIHILDLHQDGYIKPHVDAVRFCGNTIAGICLLSDAVMKLTNEKDKNKYGLALLKRRGLYIMKDTIRYDYAHEVLKNTESIFKNQVVNKTRRISIICRNEPDLEAHPEKKD
ncbi:unnamed protein product [Brachionus calyciflorus]|uniref:AlkB n=1 Tax=Brachionus calyciflorus TaxID=104777 RepID=A0A813M3W6_9BILA|nr:unnamed protein product [Brachionus calyciflorus]